MDDYILLLSVIQECRHTHTGSTCVLSVPVYTACISWCLLSLKNNTNSQKRKINLPQRCQKEWWRWGTASAYILKNRGVKPTDTTELWFSQVSCPAHFSVFANSTTTQLIKKPFPSLRQYSKVGQARSLPEIRNVFHQETISFNSWNLLQFFSLFKRSSRSL